ncbi:hypothetical protein Tsubulata_008422 [Turnera subulata]|uniref:PWWP domain-containing protein n=1 Tax=Turnera subulata TaxID=218843 RepID=A0A9Q0GA65_9ROSI|nr:hypothetical protein Tsubulata_008422 [Turnera subulata]
MKTGIFKQAQQVMRGKRCASSGSDDDSNEGGERYAADHSEEKPELGDIIWGKLCDGKWWPGVAHQMEERMHLKARSQMKIKLISS